MRDVKYFVVMFEMFRQQWSYGKCSQSLQN